MSVIIRLQNLAWSANALDIRQFFRGLSIPEGGVHIVGGEQGDAFIAFSTDEDARQAMMHDGGKIKEMKIKLLLSSRTEMQKVIETARQQTLSLQTFMQTPAVTVTQPAISTVQQQQKSSSPSEKRDNDSESSKDRKERRDRSRDRSRSRSRDRDRDRDRRDRGRDRRRRDRSRSRDRDRRDRGRRRRDRSRSRDRTRSHDRDSKRPLNDRRKDSHDSLDDNPEIVCVGQFSKDKSLPIQIPKKTIDNGIWEVPPQNQIQSMMIAPGILGAGVAALPNESEPRAMSFNSTGATPLLQPNQFSLNGINGLQAPGLGSINLNSLPPSLGLSNIGSLNRDRNSWPTEQPPRLSDIRFPRGTNFGSSDSQFGFGNNSNSNFRGNNARTGHNNLLSKMHELDGRRNPHAFQSNINPYDSFGNSDRSKPARNAGNGSRFSGDNKNSGYCIEVRNMPLTASYSDVRHAFQGLFIRKDGIKLINDTHGNRVGMAYVKFTKLEGKEIAMSTPRFVRGSEVEICSLDESIFDKAIDSYNPERDQDRDVNLDSPITILNQNTCVMIPDLPSFAKEVDIAKTFSDWKINDLFITTKKDITGSTQYAAYLQFSRPEDVHASLENPLKIGPKVITTISIPLEKFMLAKRSLDQQESVGEGNTLDCVVMRGLPFQTIDRDILDYFSDIGLIPRRIHMMLNKHGAPTGECFCEFDCTEEAIRAVGKNGIPLGKLIPTIELVSRNKMIDTLEQADAQLGDTQQPFPLALQDRPRFTPMGNHVPRFGNGGGTPFGSRGVPPPSMMNMGPGPRHPLPINRHQAPGMDYVEGFGKPGCVVSLENVPFKADINEIIEFFRDFDIKRENVIRRYNEKGMPTGDARVAFTSPGEAQRALRELRHCKVRERTIYLKLA